MQSGETQKTTVYTGFPHGLGFENVEPIKNV